MPDQTGPDPTATTPDQGSGAGGSTSPSLGSKKPSGKPGPAGTSLTSAERAERREIEAAMSRLLDGEPLRSTGELTVVQLAAEAGVKRWKLTHQHVDLMRAYQTRAATLNSESPVLADWKERVAHLEGANSDLRGRVEDLRATASIYAQVIDDLSVALEASVGSGSRLRSIR
jgi:hypothetical protein